MILYFWYHIKSLLGYKPYTSYQNSSGGGIRTHDFQVKNFLEF